MNLQHGDTDNPYRRFIVGAKKELPVLPEASRVKPKEPWEKLVSCLRTLIPLATLVRSTGNWKVSSLADRLNERDLLLAQADNLNKELRRVNMAVAELSAENSRLGRAYEELSAEYSRLGRAYEELSAEYSRLGRAYEELSAENSRLGKAYEEQSAENSRLNESWRAIIWRKWRSLTSVRKL